MSARADGLRPGTLRWWALVILLVGLIFSIFSYSRFHGIFAMRERQRQMREAGESLQDVIRKKKVKLNSSPPFQPR
jgi:hypothetical protein